MEALAAEAAKLGASDPAVVEVALRQLGSSAVRKHLNKASVLQNAADEMNSGDPIGDAPPDIEDDWLNRFEDLAAGASSERMQKLLGRVLAGEIRKPGAFSFATLNFVDVLDTQVATSLSAMAPFIIAYDFIPFTSRFNFTDMFDRILDLKHYGIISDEITRKTKFNPDKKQLFTVARTGFMVGGISEEEMSLDILPLTRVGKEIFPLIECSLSDDQTNEFVDHLFGHIKAEWIEIGTVKLIDRDNGIFTPVSRRNRPGNI